MSAFPGGYVGFLLAALATHLLVGAVLGQVTVDRPWLGALGGIVADVDLLVPRAWGWPLAHRSLTHTLLAGAVAVLVAYAVARRRDVVVAIGLGYASQLGIDATTATGVRLFAPLWAGVVRLPGDGHSVVGTAVIWFVCLGLLAVDRAVDTRAGWRRARAKIGGRFR